MVHIGNHGRQEYKRPVPYTDPKKESITCYFQVYDKLQINGACGYRLNASELRNFSFTDVFTQVNLTMSDDGTLHLTDEELTEVTSSVTRFFEPTPRRRRTANTTESNTARDQSHTSSDNGIVRLQVHPEQQSGGGDRADLVEFGLLLCMILKGATSLSFFAIRVFKYENTFRTVY